MSPLKRYRDAALVVLLLAIPFFVLRANMRNPENLNAMDRSIVRVTTYPQELVSWIAHGSSNVAGDYLYLVDVKAENERLSYENARLREEVGRLEAAQAQNQELRRLLQLRQATPVDTVSALVVTKNFNEFFRMTRVVVDHGSSPRVRPHMPVISPDGVVGSVLHVSGDAVDVQLAVDAGFALDVEDKRTRARGLVRGTGDPSRHWCKVEMVDSRDEIEVGDVLVTSGKGRWFPAGIPVARVTKVLRRELGRDQEVEATPAVDFSRLEAVLVLVTVPGEDTEGESRSAQRGR